MSNRWNPYFTGWQHKSHLITMPAAELSLAQRMARIGATGSILNPDLAIAEGRSEQAGRTLEADFVQLVPRSLSAARHIEQMQLVTWRKPATVAHLLGIAEAHREVFRTYRRIYGFGGIRRAEDGSTWLMPCLELQEDGAYILKDRRVDPDARVFTTDEHDDTFALVEPMGNCADLACKGC